MSLRADFPSAIQSRIDLNFLRDLPEYDEVKPYHISGIIPADHESSRTNMQFEKRHQVPLYNLRGQEHKLSIEKHGFEMITVPKDISHLDVKGSQKQEYINHMTEMVKRRLGATLVLCYDCRFRSSHQDKSISNDIDMGTPQRPDVPAEACHIDHTSQGAIRRARRHMTAEETRLHYDGSWRLRIANVWRPFDTVQDHDLLYCDFSTVQPDDLLAVDRVSSEYIGEVYMLKPRDHYDWYWIDHQRPEEASLFVSYDSAETGAPYCPHTSAKNPSATESVAPRESVELRMIVLS